jgi:signal transduction histidine kinase
MRELADIPSTPTKVGRRVTTQFQLSVQVAGPIDLVDHVLQIAREGISNVRRHAAAESASIDICREDSHLHISIVDDGVGFSASPVPWSIVSRVRELGGRIELSGDHRPGAHLSIVLPQTS